MKTDTVIISEDMFGGQDEMEDFLDVLERITNTPVKRVRQWKLTSESPHAVTVLTALVEGAKKSTKPTLKVERLKQHEKKLPQEFPAVEAISDVLTDGDGQAQSKEIKAWHVLVGGREVETITLTEKNRRLVDGSFETGTVLQHPKAGRNRVTGAKGTPQGMEPE